jgi:hypothetical protein
MYDRHTRSHGTYGRKPLLKTHLKTYKINEQKMERRRRSWKQVFIVLWKKQIGRGILSPTK